MSFIITIIISIISFKHQYAVNITILEDLRIKVNLVTDTFTVAGHLP
jgi:hypothetical protein